MRVSRSGFLTLFATLAITVGMVGSAAAQRQSMKQTRDLVRSLLSQVDNFGYTLNNELRGDPSQQSLDDASNALQGLQEQLDAFQQNLEARRENRDDINQIVDAARSVDVALGRGQQNQKIRQEWDAIKTNVGQLSGNYGVTPTWNGGQNTANYPSSDNNYPQSRGTYPSTSTRRPGGPPVLTRSTTPRSSSVGTSELTGTYKLDTSRSENTDQIISETNVGGTQRQDLQTKLEAPDQIAIFVRGNEVTLASSKASPVTFTADGSEKTETDANGRNLRLRASLKSQELTIASLGGDSDYTIVFSPTDGGRSLKVTRRITTPYLNQTVFADSVYTKTDAIAGLGIDTSGQDTASDSGGWSSNDNSTSSNNNTGGSNNNSSGNPTYSSPRAGDYIVPNGTIIIAQLENNIDTKISQNNDHFKMTVQSPLDYRGAVIDGHITGVGRSGRVSGNSNITFNFDTITLRNGKTYDFAGFLQSIKDQNGKSVAVDAEGTAKGGSQTKETVKRGGIGAGIGAVIGAITGGGTGAAVGAIIGGSVGAGSVVVQGRDDVQLLKGSTITLQSSSPVRDDQPSEN